MLLCFLGFTSKAAYFLFSFHLVFYHKWDIVSESGPSKICGRQPRLVHSWITLLQMFLPSDNENKEYKKQFQDVFCNKRCSEKFLESHRKAPFLLKKVSFVKFLQALVLQKTYFSYNTTCGCFRSMVFNFINPFRW